MAEKKDETTDRHKGVYRCIVLTPEQDDWLRHNVEPRGASAFIREAVDDKIKAVDRRRKRV